MEIHITFSSLHQETFLVTHYKFLKFSFEEYSTRGWVKSQQPYDPLSAFKLADCCFVAEQPLVNLKWLYELSDIVTENWVFSSFIKTKS